MELILPIAAEDQVGVTVHKTREYAASRGVQLLATGCRSAGDVLLGAGKGDDALADNYCRGAFDDVEVAHGCLAVFGFGAVACDELGDIFDVEIHVLLYGMKG